MIKMLNRVIKNIAKKIIALQPAQEIKDADLEYLLWISSLYIQISRIPGHIAEVGVADGRNTIMFARLIKIFGETSIRQYIGFDTFSGYSEQDLARDKYLIDNNERWKSNSKNEVLERCVINNVEDIVELFEGDAVKEIPKILTQHKGKKFVPNKAKFALVYIDCNAYGVALKSMQAFLPYMVPGSIFAVDEKTQGGESEAMIEFARINKLKIEKPGTNQVPMIIRL